MSQPEINLKATPKSKESDRRKNRALAGLPGQGSVVQKFFYTELTKNEVK